MLHGDREHTADGNPKPPHMRVYLQWICDAWDSLSREVIEKSFKTCGLSTDTSGAEDHLIRCMGPDGPIPGGREALKASRINDSTSME
ncbi:transposase [Aphelenchoides avenae]|nr:transposase [Aphelenchus avenae]